MTYQKNHKSGKIQDAQNLAAPRIEMVAIDSYHSSNVTKTFMNSSGNKAKQI